MLIAGNRMNFGFSTFFFVQKPVQEVVEDIIAHGVKTIELSLEIPHLPDVNDDFIKRMALLSKDGVDFSIHAPFFEMNLGSYQTEIRQFSRRKAKTAIDIAYAIGANPVVMHPGYTFWMDKIKDVVQKSWEFFVKDMQGLLSYAKKKNITIALESIPMHFFFFYDLPEFKKLQELLPGLGMTLDIGHAYVAKVAKKVKDPEGTIIKDIRELGIQNVTHVHLHNNKGKRDEHLFPDGDIDMKRFLGFLEEERYAGKLIIESYEMERKGIPSVLEKIKSITN
jgi:sugar phosphate isomerase/epimerase